MQMLRFFTLLFMSMFFAALPAQACTPCQTTWPMERMVAESEIVILGERVDDILKYQYAEDENGFYKVKVEELLKPYPEIEVGDVLKVQSWYGICPYGLQMDRHEQAVIFLNKAQDGTWFSSPTYEAATYKHALCNDEAMTIDKKDMLVWDPVVRQTVKYPLAEFRRVFLNRYQVQTVR